MSDGCIEGTVGFSDIIPDRKAILGFISKAVLRLKYVWLVRLFYYTGIVKINKEYIRNNYSELGSEFIRCTIDNHDIDPDDILEVIPRIVIDDAREGDFEMVHYFMDLVWFTERRDIIELMSQKLIRRERELIEMVNRRAGNELKINFDFVNRLLNWHFVDFSPKIREAIKKRTKKEVEEYIKSVPDVKRKPNKVYDSAIANINHNMIAFVANDKINVDLLTVDYVEFAEMVQNFACGVLDVNTDFDHDSVVEWIDKDDDQIEEDVDAVDDID